MAYSKIICSPGEHTSTIMKVYYSFGESGGESSHKMIYVFLRALTEEFKVHMELLKEKIERENGFFVIRIEKDFTGYFEFYGFSKELENEMIAMIRTFNDEDNILRIFQNLSGKV